MQYKYQNVQRANAFVGGVQKKNDFITKKLRISHFGFLRGTELLNKCVQLNQEESF